MNDILEQIRNVVGANGVLTGGDVKSRATSWTRQQENKAGAIVRPASTEE